MEADEEGIARGHEVFAFQRFRKSVAEGLDDVGRIGVVAVVNRQRFAAVSRRSFDGRVRFTDAESIQTQHIVIHLI